MRNVSIDFTAVASTLDPIMKLKAITRMANTPVCTPNAQFGALAFASLLKRSTSANDKPAIATHNHDFGSNQNEFPEPNIALTTKLNEAPMPVKFSTVPGLENQLVTATTTIIEATNEPCETYRFPRTTNIELASNSTMPRKLPFFIKSMAPGMAKAANTKVNHRRDPVCTGSNPSIPDVFSPVTSQTRYTPAIG